MGSAVVASARSEGNAVRRAADLPPAYNAIDVLERNLPEWDEPPLGVIADGAFWYVANSHWPSFPGDDSAPTDVTKLSPTSVRRLALD